MPLPRYRVTLSTIATTVYELPADTPEDALVLAQRCAKDGPMGIHLKIVRLATTYTHTTATSMIPTDG